MHRDLKPTFAAGFVTGAVGSPMSSGSAGMAAICRRAGTPLVVYRDDGIEPAEVLPMLRALWTSAPWARERIAVAGRAVKADLAGARETVMALRDAEPRLGPWLAACVG